MAISRPTVTNDSGDHVSGTSLNAAFFTALFDGIEVNWGLDSYTPTWTGAGSNPALGNGTITGRYVRIGKHITFMVSIVMGTTTTFGTGGYSVSLPLSADTTFPGLINVFATDSSAGGVAYNGVGYVSTTTTVALLTQHDSLAGGYNSTSPITFATGDTIKVAGVYFRA